ncbi:MAG: trypsin-like serine protease [Aquitalea sp.]|nr:trypsin-like serine protease [Aquitalea sp.]
MLRHFLLCLSLILAPHLAQAKPTAEQMILFFGKDDRVKTDPDSPQWQPVGQLETRSHLLCTATLVAEDVVVTAGHCFINKHGRFDPAITFTVGLAGREFSEQSGIRSVQVDKTFLAGLEHRPDGTYIPKKIAGRDFAFVRLSQPLGRSRGTIAVFPGNSAQLQQQLQAINWKVTNGGYPLDDLSHLLVHTNCQATGLLADGRLTHRCDTLEGNSGSPILARINGRMVLVGIQSSAPSAARRRKEDNMALSSPVFYQQLQQFIQQGRSQK